MNKKAALHYLIGTFALTYAAWGTIAIANRLGHLAFGQPLAMILYLLGGLSPTIVSYFALKKAGEIRGFKDLAKETFAFNQKPLYYGLALVFVALHIGIPVVTGHAAYQLPWYMGIVLIAPMIVGGGLEELGWRRLLQPTLEKRLPFWLASLITAVIWWLWHWPLFHIAGTIQSTMSFWIFGIKVLGLAFALAAVYRISRSIWLCIFLHATTNAFLSVWIIADIFWINGCAALAMILLAALAVSLHERKGAQDRAGSAEARVSGMS